MHSVMRLMADCRLHPSLWRGYINYSNYSLQSSDLLLKNRFGDIVFQVGTAPVNSIINYTSCYSFCVIREWSYHFLLWSIMSIMSPHSKQVAGLNPRDSSVWSYHSLHVLGIFMCFLVFAKISRLIPGTWGFLNINPVHVEILSLLQSCYMEDFKYFGQCCNYGAF